VRDDERSVLLASAVDAQLFVFPQAKQTLTF
jgi:hypothetical protein